MDDDTLELAVDVARFHVQLVSCGVPQEQAAVISAAFVNAIVMCPANHTDPDADEPWRKG